MSELSYGTAGLLFPAISLLMLAYTNRFLGLTSAARSLAARYRQSPDASLARQVQSLRERLVLVRHTQALGVLSLSMCTVCIGCLLMDNHAGARIAFAGALLLMLASLAISLREIHLSVGAIQIELDSLSGHS
ncbi:MAG: DUF2721 domain-containing protein [Stagnimonas sp.]|nr:DUF2721 domain-containing protein [Stagnimonas sp.]